MHPGPAEQVVEAGPLERLGVEPHHVGGQVVRHQGDRVPTRGAEPFDVDDGLALGDTQLRGDPFDGADDLEPEHGRARLLVAVRQVVVQARELQGPTHLGLDHARADAPATHDQALVDELLHGPAHRRPRDAEPLGHGDLVVEQRALGEGAAGDRLLEVLGDLEPEGDGACPVDGEGREPVVGGPVRGGHGDEYVI